MNALIAVGVIVAGFVLGSLAAAFARRLASAESRPEGIRNSASAVATLAFSVVLIAAMVTALGLLSRSSLDQLSDDLLDFLPKLLSAAIVLIMGNIVGAIAEAGVARSLGHVAPAVRKRVPGIVKWAIFGFAMIVAANQLGIDTTIITVAVQALFFSVALAVALLSGLGGRDVAAKVAAGRALRQQLNVGDAVKFGDIDGVIAAIGSTSTQVTTADKVLLVPNDEALASTLWIIPADDASDGQDES